MGANSDGKGGSPCLFVCETRFVVKSWGAPPKSLGRCGSARAQSIFLPSITLGCKNLKHTTQGHSKHG